jgi:hypothetical protein
MDRPSLLDTLDKATDRAATFAIQRGMPISVSKKSVRISNTLIEKNKNGFYDVLSLDRNILYSNISVFDVAVIVAQRHSNGEMSAVKRVIQLEEKFSKYHSDMTHYLHCYKSAKKKNDFERMFILEDKFQMSEILAKSTRDNISIFKRVK